MEIKGKVHCFFEQSGTFKREFIKLGIPAEDYDIQDNFGETDHRIDLFAEIENAYGGGASIFDSITCDDLVMAFFPCIYFCAWSQMDLYWDTVNLRRLPYDKQTELIIKRSQDREVFWRLAVKMLTVAKVRGIRLIMENPWSEQTYLKANFILAPSLIDRNRMVRGDYFMKPTAYWFVNATPTHGFSEQNDKVKKTQMKTRGSKQAGVCSEDRSMISPDYARNFICDFILGKEQVGTQLSMF